jgi:signal transduction histidine kinase
MPLMTAPIEARRLYRVTDARVVAGVAAGIAAHLNASVLLVRIAFVVLASFNGLGALLYAAFWAVLPVAPGQRGSSRNRRQLVPFIALGAGIILVQALSGSGGFRSVIGWLVAIVAVGVGIIWRQADPKRRERWTAAVPQAPWLGAVLENDRRGFMLRIVGGGVLIGAGVIGTVAVASGAELAKLGNGLLFAALALAGAGLALAPLLWRVFSQLGAEREARIREQERAEVAAMIHDQVLHTLALIQRSAGDPKGVVRLARAQERTLRGWLYKSSASPAERFGAALEEAAAEVEDTYAIAVETVVVGDRDVDDRIRALVAAAREALVNAGRHAKVSSVSLYAEVEPDQASVFVRDRGVGFDPTTVDDDRHGVRGSIIGRMKRHGGRAEIRSEPGGGTEVRLIMPTPGWSPAEEDLRAEPGDGDFRAGPGEREGKHS